MKNECICCHLETAVPYPSGRCEDCVGDGCWYLSDNEDGTIGWVRGSSCRLRTGNLSMPEPIINKSYQVT
jgi:hypothetical protein